MDVRIETQRPEPDLRHKSKDGDYSCTSVTQVRGIFVLVCEPAQAKHFKIQFHFFVAKFQSLQQPCLDVVRCRQRTQSLNGMPQPRILAIPHLEVESALLLASVEDDKSYVKTKENSWSLNRYNLDLLMEKGKRCEAGFPQYPGNSFVIFVTHCNAVDAFLKSVMRETHYSVVQKLPCCRDTLVQSTLQNTSTRSVLLRLGNGRI
jgi:hypothetical protein